MNWREALSSGFVRGETWRYYRAIHYAPQSASAIPSSSPNSLSARYGSGECPAARQLHLWASSRLRASQWLLDQPSSHALSRSQVADGRRAAGQERQDFRTNSEHDAECETHPYV